MRVAIVDDSEVGDPRDENSERGLRLGNRLIAPDFRGKAEDQLQETNVRVNQWSECGLLKILKLVILAMKIRKAV